VAACGRRRRSFRVCYLPGETAGTSVGSPSLLLTVSPLSYALSPSLTHTKPRKPKEERAARSWGPPFSVYQPQARRISRGINLRRASISRRADSRLAI
jgi:hypothetical protein